MAKTKTIEHGSTWMEFLHRELSLQNGPSPQALSRPRLEQSRGPYRLVFLCIDGLWAESPRERDPGEAPQKKSWASNR